MMTEWMLHAIMSANINRFLYKILQLTFFPVLPKKCEKTTPMPILTETWLDLHSNASKHSTNIELCWV